MHSENNVKRLQVKHIVNYCRSLYSNANSWLQDMVHDAGCGVSPEKSFANKCVVA